MKFGVFLPSVLFPGPGPEHAALASHITRELDQLAAIVRALAVLREVSPRTLDVVAAIGELLSSRIVAAALTHAGVPAEWVDARLAIVTVSDGPIPATTPPEPKSESCEYVSVPAL